MYKESTTIEAKKPEEVGHEAQPEQSLESPEDLRNRMASESAQVVDHFKGGCADDLAQVTARAEKDGLTIDPENSGALEALSGEADLAHTQLLAETEMHPPDPEEEINPTQIMQAGQDKLQELRLSGETEGAFHMALHMLLTKTENGVNVWRGEEEIDMQKVEKILEYIKQTDPQILDPEDDETSFSGQAELETESIPSPESKEGIQEGINSSFHKIDKNLARLRLEGEEYLKYIEGIKNLPPDATVHLYHGLKGDSHEGVLAILNSKEHGIEQRSGPTLSLVPSGGFWVNSLGFRYTLKRNQIAFPGEKNPNAVVRIGGEGSVQDVGYIEDASGKPSNLSLAEFEGEIMYGEGAKLDKDSEEKINDRLQQFAEIRHDLNDINTNIAIEQKDKIETLRLKAKKWNFLGTVLLWTNLLDEDLGH